MSDSTGSRGRAPTTRDSEVVYLRLPGMVDPLRRLAAFLVDAMIVCGLLFTAARGVAVVPELDQDLGFGLFLLGSILAVLYILFRDGLGVRFMDHRSVGKRLLGLRPVRDHGLPMTWMTSVGRNWPLALALVGIGSIGLFTVFVAEGAIRDDWIIALWPVALVVEAVLVLPLRKGRRLGDFLAGTFVVEDHD